MFIIPVTVGIGWFASPEHHQYAPPSAIEGIVAARPVQPSVESMRGWLATLEQGLGRDEREAIYRALRDAVPDFRGEAA